jgi:hypothetical protein
MASRYYTIDGESYPSVTSILNVLNKPQLVNWAVRLTRDCITQDLFAFKRADSINHLDLDNLLANSADHGIAVHSSIVSYVSNKSNVA